MTDGPALTAHIPADMRRLRFRADRHTLCPYLGFLCACDPVQEYGKQVRGPVEMAEDACPGLLAERGPGRL